MINKQPTTLTFSHHDGTVLSKFILAFYYLAQGSQIRQIDLDGRKQFLTRMLKILSGRMMRDGEKPHVSFKAYNSINNILYLSIHSYLNRHI